MTPGRGLDRIVTLDDHLRAMIEKIVDERVARALAKLKPAERLSVPDAAKHAGCSAKTVRRWIASGRLPAERCGRKIVVRRSDVDTALRREPNGELSPEAFADLDDRDFGG